MSDVEVDLSDLDLGSDKAVRAMTKGIKLGVTRGTMLIQRDAKALCPVDTGRLRGSIARAVNTTDEGFEGFVGTSVEYAPYVEYGTGRRGSLMDQQYGPEDAGITFSKDRLGQVAQPFLRSAFYSNQENVRELLAKSAEEMLEKAFPQK